MVIDLLSTPSLDHFIPTRSLHPPPPPRGPLSFVEKVEDVDASEDKDVPIELSNMRNS